MFCFLTFSINLVSLKHAFAQIEYCKPDTTGCTLWQQSFLNIIPPCANPPAIIIRNEKLDPKLIKTN